MANQGKTKVPSPGRPENLRTEYEALSNYFRNVITFRFTTCALFLPAVALFLTPTSTDGFAHWHVYVLLFFVTVGVWIVELRNRSIFYALLDRGMAIEAEWYPELKESRQHFSFYRRLLRREVVIKENKEREDDRQFKVPEPDPTKIIFLGETRLFAEHLTHTVGFDIVYLSVMLYTLVLAVYRGWASLAIGSP